MKELKRKESLIVNSLFFIPKKLAMKIGKYKM